MIWVLIIVGLVALLTIAHAKPDWFKNVWETTLAQVWIIASGFLTQFLEYFNADTTWQQLVAPKYVPWAIVGIAVLLIMIRNVNASRS